MKGILSILFVLLLVLSTSPALAADSAAGKKLYDTNCSKCHDSSIHTRPDHKIKSLDALDKQLMQSAPWAPYGNRTWTTFTSDRVNQDSIIFHPVFQEDFSSFQFTK